MCVVIYSTQMHHVISEIPKIVIIILKLRYFRNFIFCSIDIYIILLIVSQILPLFFC